MELESDYELLQHMAVKSIPGLAILDRESNAPQA
jgi:hypothetical protein